MRHNARLQNGTPDQSRKRSGLEARCPLLRPCQKSISAALTAALTHLGALHQATCQLEVEAQAAEQAASKSDASVRALVDQIMDAEARQIVNEFVATQELSWQLEDRLKAVFGLDAKRQHPHLLDLKKELNMKAERHNREQAKDPQLIEAWKWTRFLEARAEEQAQRWHDYGQRLANDASATLDVESAS